MGGIISCHHDSVVKFMEPLMDKGIIPPMVSRIIIDIPCDSAIKIYYETFAEEGKLDVLLDASLKIMEAQAEIKKTDGF